MKNRILAILLGPTPFLLIFLLFCIPVQYAKLMIVTLSSIIILALMFMLLYFLGFLILMLGYKLYHKDEEIDQLIEDIFFWIKY